MHLALKSAMSRIPYTNKVGETLGSIANPAAAYSLRALNGGDPMVARVRRSSDDTEKDFTASDVSGGALVNWVNEDVVITNAAFTNIGGTYDTFSGSSSSGFTATNTASDGRALSNLTISTPQVGDKFKINYNLTLNSGSGINFLLATTTGATASNSVEVAASGTGSIELTSTNLDVATLRVNAIGNVDFALSDLNVTAIQSSGHVTTWYDQSGNGNNATQSTASSQPKIVDGGTLVSDGIKFDGIDDLLKVDSDLGMSGDDISKSMFSVATNSSTTIRYIISLGNNNDNSPFIHLSSANNYYRYAERGNTDSGDLLEGGIFGGLSVISGLNSGTSRTLYGEGSLIQSTTLDLPSITLNKFTIGALGRTTNTGFWDNSISEIIIYNSDQSSNRAAIETNINNHYDIY